MDTTLPSRPGRAWRRPFQILVATLFGLLSLAATAVRAADTDPPGRVGRLAELEGPVTLLDAERGDWREAERNRPLTSGDRLATGPRARAEVRVGSTVLRLAERSEIEFSRLDDERLAVRVHRGSLALRVSSRETAEEAELITGEALITPTRAGLYRIDRLLDGDRDRTRVLAWRGALRIDGGPAVDSGERLLLWREGARLRHAEARNDSEADEFADWVAREDRRDARQDEQVAQSAPRRVSPEMTGAEELDRHGRWESHPEHGWIWLPMDVAPDWQPYRDGRWVWLRPWGWTWVDRAPWGFAPFHYGRWMQWRGRWAWWPGEYTVRPVYAPALVAWAGTPNLNVSIHIGAGPGVGWAPLAPRQHYRPWYRHTERHAERVDPWNPAWGPRMRQEPPHAVPMPGQSSLIRKPIEQVRDAVRDDARPAPSREQDRGRERDGGRDRGRDRDRDQVRPQPVPMPSILPSPTPAPPQPPRMGQQGPTPLPAPAVAAPRGEQAGIAQRLLERQREAAAREAPARAQNDDDGRKRPPAQKPAERAEERRADRPGPQR